MSSEIGIREQLLEALSDAGDSLTITALREQILTSARPRLFIDRVNSITGRHISTPARQSNPLGVLFGEVLVGMLSQGFAQPNRPEIKEVAIEKITVVYEDIPKECCICLVPFESKDRITIRKCKHCFHEKCLDTWEQTGGQAQNANCPICRK